MVFFPTAPSLLLALALFDNAAALPRNNRDLLHRAPYQNVSTNPLSFRAVQDSAGFADEHRLSSADLTRNIQEATMITHIPNSAATIEVREAPRHSTTLSQAIKQKTAGGSKCKSKKADAAPEEGPVTVTSSPRKNTNKAYAPGIKGPVTGIAQTTAKGANANTKSKNAGTQTKSVTRSVAKRAPEPTLEVLGEIVEARANSADETGASSSKTKAKAMTTTKNKTAADTIPATKTSTADKSSIAAKTKTAANTTTKTTASKTKTSAVAASTKKASN